MNNHDSYALQVNSLTVNIKQRILLQSINFQINAGQVLGIIGPNGAGKSTLLRTVGGDIKTYGGEILFAGRPRKHWSMRELACCVSGLPQQSTLNFPFTVQEVVAMARLPHQSGVHLDKQITDTVMQQLDLAHLAHSIYTHLSGGEKQRVQLARVIAQLYPPEQQPLRVLLLDEPTSGLDLKHQQRLLEILRALKHAGVCVLVSCHDLPWIAKVCDQILLLHNSRQVAWGSAQSILQAELLQAVFEVPINLSVEPSAVNQTAAIY